MDHHHTTDPDEAEALRREMASARARLDELEARLSAAGAPSEPATSRRRLLGLAGAAAAGGAASLLASGRAAAATGTMQFGASQNAGTSETALHSIAPNTLYVTNTIESAAIRASSSGSGVGVIGQVLASDDAGIGVWGRSPNNRGYAAKLTGGQSQLQLEPDVCGPSLGIYHRAGEVAFDSQTDALWVCVLEGAPGTWRMLAGLYGSGAFQPITPTRVYDSRKPSPNPLNAGLSRTISVANRIDLGSGAVTGLSGVPASATAIAYTLTVTDTVGRGYLGVNEGGNTTLGASTINWGTTGTVLANTSVVKLNTNRQVTVICGGTAASTNCIVDIVGYYY